MVLNDQNLQSQNAHPAKEIKINFTKANNAQSVASDSSGALRGLSKLLGAVDLLAFPDHVGQPVGAAVQVEDEAESGVGHLLHPVARHIAHRNACVGRER